MRRGRLGYDGLHRCEEQIAQANDWILEQHRIDGWRPIDLHVGGLRLLERRRHQPRLS